MCHPPSKWGLAACVFLFSFLLLSSLVLSDTAIYEPMFGPAKGPPSGNKEECSLAPWEFEFLETRIQTPMARGRST